MLEAEPATEIARRLVGALTEREVDVCEDLTEAWGAELPEGRFSGTTAATARVSITPQEAVELAKRAYALGANTTDEGNEKS